MSEADAAQPVTEGVKRPGRYRRLQIAAAIAALTGVGAWSNGTISPAAIAAAVQDPMSLFAKRSPGARADGALTQSKLRQTKRRLAGVRRPRTLPSERVLPGVRSRPIATAGIGDPGAIILPDGPLDIVLPGGPVFGFDPGGGGGGDFIPPGSNSPGVGVLIPDPDPTPPGPPVGPPVAPPTPVPPIPEPATWLTMLVGLFATGTALRRRSRAPRLAARRG